MLLKPHEDNAKLWFRVLCYLLLPKGQLAFEIPWLWLLDKFILFRCSYNYKILKQGWLQASFQIAGLTDSWTVPMLKLVLRDYLYSENVECPLWYLWCLFPSYLGLYTHMAIGGHIIYQIVLQSLLLWHWQKYFGINYFA